MFGVDPHARVYLAAGATDMRKSIDGLSLLVVDVLRADPLSAQLFCFCNRARDKVKILQWTGSAFWLHYKRLEQGRFRWPAAADAKDRCVVLSRRELDWLLEGLPLEQPRAHRHLGVDCLA